MEGLWFGRWEFPCFLEGVLEVFEGRFAGGEGFRGLRLVHLLGETGTQVLGHVAGCVLGQVHSSLCEHLVGLVLDNGHLLAELDFAAVQTYKQVAVKCVYDLILLTEVPLAQ